MRKFIITLIFLTSSSYSFAQIDSLWVRTYHSGGNEEIRAVATDISGNVYCAGRYQFPYYRFVMMKYNANGVLQWISLDATESGSEPYDITVSNDGYIYAVGADNAIDPDMLLVKYSPGGDTIWTRSYNGSAVIDNLDIGLYVTTDNENNVIITGRSKDALLLEVVTTVKYSSDGTMLWKRDLRGLNRGGRPVALTTDHNNNIIVGGYLINNFFDSFVIKYKPNGDIDWIQNDSLPGTDKLKDLKVDSQGNVYAVGFHHLSKYLQKLYKYDPSGNLIWVKTFGESFNNGAVGTRVEVSDSDIYVTSTETDPNHNNYVWLLKYNSLGDTIWTKRTFISFEEGIADYEGNLLQYKNGYSFVSSHGVRSPNAPPELITTLINENGQEIGTTGYTSNTPFPDILHGSFVDHRGYFYLYGAAAYPSPSGGDMLIVKYTSSAVGITLQNSEIPNRFELKQNYPNPFNPSTKIAFSIPKNGFTSLKIYDMVGREVATLLSKDLQSGNYEIDFNGSKLASGVYFYQLISNDFVEVKKMMLVK